MAFTASEIGDIDFRCVVTNQAGTAASCLGHRSITPPARCIDSAFMPNGQPYLQLGTAPASPATLALLWLSGGDHDADWRVEVYAHGAWMAQGPPTFVRVDLGVAGEPLHRVYTQPLAGLPAGGEFFYRVRVGPTVVFQNRGKALKGPTEAQRVVIAGDLVTGATVGQARRMADRCSLKTRTCSWVPGISSTWKAMPSRTRNTLFPIYNSTVQGPAHGAP